MSVSCQSIGDVEECVGTPWWADAVVYQVYLRSFADGSGDGVGDLAGLRSKLPYLADLGADALWINPWYPSPMADGGYDVADYRAIHPDFGSLADAESLINEAHRLGLRVLADIVPNHTSSAHTWFRAALAGDAAARERYVFRDGRGEDGAQAPNDWESCFGGPAWTRLPDGQWYLHLFAPDQPDLNWSNPEVVAEFEDVLRFWFDRGLDGFRIDVAHGLMKQPDLADAGPRIASSQHLQAHPAWDQDSVHEVYRGWRTIADSYDPPKVFVGEIWVPDNDRLVRYLRPDELHTAFQFDFLRTPWRADALRTVIDDARESVRDVGAPPTWVLSNHDVTRVVTRYARHQPQHPVEADWDRGRWPYQAPDIDLGRRRARAAALLQLALPGTAYIYQGEEWGLDEVEDLDGRVRQDPMWVQSDFTDPGRDGCRVPLPWGAQAGANLGFSPDGAVPAWLPQPESWAGLTHDEQVDDPDSFLTLYRAALRIRHQLWCGAEGLVWLDSGSDALAFRRGDLECWVNTGARPLSLPSCAAVLLSSVGLVDGKLPGDAAVWLRH
ncbi:glycoside hydrolase family 13 protein [Gordonia sp. N1V]|uniref:glycoside hydrolase family 13 protein n=1 Tax=Gordonia sp. N1V TaxID=3034163 RepID=UPI0023E29947|nr:glycoside hydrolase family 13 protein [Gordonia sp. N1V]MDF3284540.1 glycoside hydrolase family 13 protein [Gordonia sp. N1V]